MSEQSQYQDALALAKAGKLEQAQSLLLTLESEQAEKLLTKVNAAIAARGSSPKTEAPKAKRKGLDFVGLLIGLGIFIVSAMISGFLGNVLWNTGGGNWGSTTINIIAFILFVGLMVFGMALTRRIRG